MNRTTNTILAFLVGIATGAILGILFAPDKGTNTRDKLSYRMNRYKDKLQDLVDDMISNDPEPESEAKDQGEKIVTATRNKAEKLLDDVNNMIEQIRKK